MILKADWTFIHGWGLGGFFFHPLQALLPQAKLWERGYFGPATRRPIPPRSWVMAHSLGLHWLGPEDANNLEGLVILAGFADFLPGRAQVKAMGRKLRQDPQALLRDFYRQLFAPAPCPLTPPRVTDQALLAQDLESLLSLSLPLESLAPIPRVYILQGEADHISPLSQAKALATILPQAKLKVFSQGGHAFAQVNPQACLDWLREVA